MAKVFSLQEYDTIPGTLFINGPDELDIAIALDMSVENKPKVRRGAKKIVRLLNKHWNDGKKKAPTP